MKFDTVYPSLSGLLLLIVCMVDTPNRSLAQEPIFELPVQLVGFPAIIFAVRLSNFVKKLSYSLNPQTYQTRNRRSPSRMTGVESSEFSQTAIDLALAEKQIIAELGPKACVLEEPCKLHATRKARVGAQPEWGNILRDYKHQSHGMKEWYLLSVFLGDVMRDVSICRQLAKRMECGRGEAKELVRD